MIAHIVLLQPRPGLGPAERQAALRALTGAAGRLPGVVRFRIGRRVTHGLPGYEQAMAQDFEFALLLEFDSIDALKAYLTAPAHSMLGDLFSTATSAALAYDYDLREATELGAGDSAWVNGLPS
jgi:hypothetical protein